jgi:hypothetical protein
LGILQGQKDERLSIQERTVNALSLALYFSRNSSETFAQIRESFTRVSREFHESFARVSREFHGSFTGVSREIRESFAGVSREFRESFAGVSRTIERSRARPEIKTTTRDSYPRNLCKTISD